MRVRMKVCFDSSIYGYAEPGDILDVPPKIAKEMMDVGYVEPVKETKPHIDAPAPTSDVDAAVAALHEAPRRRGRRR